MYRKCLKMTGILLLAALFTTVAWSSVQAEEPQITIDFWVGGGNRHIPGYDTPNHGDWERLLAREFEKLHPNVKINVEIISFSDIEQKVNVAVAGQNPPDILYDNIPNRVMRHAEMESLSLSMQWSVQIETTGKRISGPWEPTTEFSMDFPPFHSNYDVRQQDDPRT